MVDVFIDGSCKGNPGPMSIAIAIPEYKFEQVFNLAEIGTNNIAEYSALERAILYIRKKRLEGDASPFVIKSDSQLMVKQLNREWKVKDKKLLPMFQSASKAMKHTPNVTLVWIPREENVADKLFE